MSQTAMHMYIETLTRHNTQGRSKLVVFPNQNVRDRAHGFYKSIPRMSGSAYCWYMLVHNYATIVLQDSQ